MFDRVETEIKKLKNKTIGLPKHVEKHVDIFIDGLSWLVPLTIMLGIIVLIILFIIGIFFVFPKWLSLILIGIGFIYLAGLMD